VPLSEQLGKLVDVLSSTCISERIEGRALSAALTPNPAEDAIGLQTGYFDDERQLLSSEHERYRLFRWANDHQDQWSDSEHRAFWLPRLHLWPRTRGAHSTRQTLSFALAVGLSDGFTLDEIAAELPFRSRDVLRDKHLQDARKWQRSLDQGRSKHDRQSRLPRVYLGGDERSLPQPPSQNWTFGWINLPIDMPESSIHVGTPALQVFEEVCGALARLRARRGWPSLADQVAAAANAPLDCDDGTGRAYEPVPVPPSGEIGYSWEPQLSR